MLPNQHAQKEENLSNLSPKEKKFPWTSWKYFFTQGRHIPKTSIAEKSFGKCHCWTVIFDTSQTTILKNKRIWIILALKKKELWSLTFLNLAPAKQKNLSILWSKERKSSLMPLNFFYVTQKLALNFQCKKFFGKLLFTNYDAWSLLNWH